VAAQVQLELPQAGQGAWQRFLEVHYTVSGACSFSFASYLLASFAFICAAPGHWRCELS
jgi:hypothetical protein